MLGRLGEKALPCLPALIRRVHEVERDREISDRATGALARLAPLLPEPLRTWLGVVANPFRNPTDCLDSAIAERRLPEEVEKAFAALCQRRGVWWAQVRKKEGAAFKGDPPSGWEKVQKLTRDVVALAAGPAGARGQNEAGWLLSRLWELLQQHYAKT
jgi:hypothetical protein